MGHQMGEACLDSAAFAKMVRVSLRGAPLEAEATTPDGRVVQIRVGVPDDSYIPKRELDTVTVELYANGEHVAAVNTVLDADQTDAARDLLHEIVAGLESGDLPPTAGALEPLADRLR
jgi:hypothetical protein